MKSPEGERESSTCIYRAALPGLINSNSSAVQKILSCETGRRQIQATIALKCCWSKQISEVLKRENKKELACLLWLGPNCWDMVGSSPLPNRSCSSPAAVDRRQPLACHSCLPANSSSRHYCRHSRENFLR
jgi:hypothetical protein